MKEKLFYNVVGYGGYGMGLISALMIFKPKLIGELMILNLIGAVLWSLVLATPEIWRMRKSAK